MATPKRVWSNKKTVRDGHKSVWLEDWQLKTFDWTWETAWENLSVYGSEWTALPEDAELQTYDSTTPEEIWTPEDGVEATYKFKNYDGTVLKTGKIKDGWTPVPPTDPTREATAQYTYTFNGWSPSVGPIYKNTEYTATYTSTVNQYTITFVDDDGTTVLDEQTLDYWATPVYAGETPTKEATQQYTYTFSGWTPAITTVTEDATYTATYTAEAIVTQKSLTFTSYDNWNEEEIAILWPLSSSLYVDNSVESFPYTYTCENSSVTIRWRDDDFSLTIMDWNSTTTIVSDPWRNSTYTESWWFIDSWEYFDWEQWVDFNNSATSDYDEDRQSNYSDTVISDSVTIRAVYWTFIADDPDGPDEPEPEPEPDPEEWVD